MEYSDLSTQFLGFYFFNTTWIQHSLFAIVDKIQPAANLKRKI